MESRHREQPSAPISAPKGRLEVQRIGAEVAIHDKGDGSLHLLNETAALVWLARSEGAGNAEIVARLLARFPDVPADRLREDVAAAIAEFDSKRI